MRDRELSARLLGIEAPWHVQDVELRLEEGEVQVRLAPAAAVLRCPHCGDAAPGYDARERRWRHLDSCQYRTIAIAEVPRVACATHGVVQIAQRAVARGLARRPAVHLQRIGVDETSFQKHHRYVTVVCDLEREVVLYVADDRREDSLAAFL